MSNTKKGFIKAGVILAIVSASLGFLISVLLFSAGVNFSEKQMIEIFKEDDSYTYYENADGSYYFVETDEETGEQTVVKENEIELVVKVMKGVLIFAACLEIGLDIAIFPIAIKLLKATNRDVEKKSLTIALLVLSALIGELLTTAFMIVALCLKNKKKTSEYQQITIE